MAKKHRKPTEGEVTDYINKMQTDVAAKMDEIQKLVPPGYMITLVCRHPTMNGAGFVFTKDKNLEAVADEVLATHRTLKAAEGGDDKH